MTKAPDRVLQRRSGVLTEPRALSEPKEFGRVDINGSIFLVTEREISFEQDILQTAAITGIRFGIYKHYVNGIRSSQSYKIWLSDPHRVLAIECAKGFLVSDSKIEQRYQDALKVLWPAVMVPLVSHFLDALAAGRGFTVGDLTFDKSGLHRAGSMGALAKGAFGLWSSVAGGKSVEQREAEYRHLPWSDYGGHTTASGKIHLYRNKASWADFSLRDTWNAVCLDPMFDFLYKEGRLWKFVGGGQR